MTRRVLLGLAMVVLCGGAGKSPLARNEIRFPDLPGYVTLKCDFHMHTVFSDGNVWPTVRVDEAWREGLDAISLTEHVEYQPHKQDVSTDISRPHEIAAGRAAERGILLIRGAEISPTTPPGHHNAIFLADANALKAEDFYVKIDRAASQNAFLFWNHPGWQGAERGKWGEAQDRLLKEKKLHGIEVCNGATYYVDAHRYAMEHNLTVIGNSDMHDPSPFWERTPEDHRTMTLVFAKDRSIEAIREALLAGRTLAWSGNQLIGKEPHLRAMFDACVKVGRVRPGARNNLWAEVTNLSELDIELVKPGTDISDPRKKRDATVMLSAGATTLVNLPVPAGHAGLVEVPYTAMNFLAGPDEPLMVKLAITVPATTPATAPAAK